MTRAAAIARRLSAFLAAVLLCFGAITTPAAAQGVDENYAASLRDAVRQLARDPDGIEALLSAAKASMMLGDSEAATEFLERAERVEPFSGRVKAMRARAALRAEDPVAALTLFDEAERLGSAPTELALDRGLAWDLVGNLARAQREYERVPQLENNDEFRLREGVSLMLSGNTARGGQVLAPLLTANDAGAWRAQAFVKAATGQVSEANRIANSFLDASAARAMQPYFQLMSRLTPAQQMAAIHYGHFPSDNIGKDSAELIAMSGLPAAQPNANASTPGRTVASNSGGRKRGKPTPAAFLDFKGSPQPDVAAAYRKSLEKAEATQPTPARVITPGRTALPDKSRPAQSTASAANTSPSATRSVAPPVERDVVVRESSANAAPVGPSFSTQPGVPDLRETNPQDTLAEAGRNATREASQGAAGPMAGSYTPSVDQVGATGPLPSTYRPSVAATDRPSNAASSNPARETAPQPVAEGTWSTGLSGLLEDVPLKKESASSAVVPVTPDKIPARAATPKFTGERTIGDSAWVQLGTGSANADFGYDFGRMKKLAPSLFTNVAGYSSPVGEQSRLIVGPFDSLSDASAWLREFTEAGGQGVALTVDAGLPLKKIGK